MPSEAFLVFSQATLAGARKIHRRPPDAILRPSGRDTFRSRLDPRELVEEILGRALPQPGFARWLCPGECENGVDGLGLHHEGGWSHREHKSFPKSGLGHPHVGHGDWDV